MKKLIAMVMTAAMVASLVPATAFAGSSDIKATASIVDSWTKKDTFSGDVVGTEVPEVRITIDEAKYMTTTGKVPTAEIVLTLDNADFDEALMEGQTAAPAWDAVKVIDTDGLPTEGLVYGDAADVVMTTYGKALTGSALENAVKAILNGSTEYAKVPAAKAGTTVQETFTAVVDTDIIGAINSTGSGAAAAIAAYADAADEGTTSDKYIVTIESELEKDLTEDVLAKLGLPIDDQFDFFANYTWNAATKKFVKNSSYTGAGKDSYTLAEIEAVTGETYADKTNTNAIVNDDNFKAWLGTDVIVKATTKSQSQQNVTAGGQGTSARAVIDNVEVTEDDEVTITVSGWFLKGDVICVDLYSTLGKIKNAYVAVDSDDMTIANGSEDLAYVIISDEDITAEIKKIAKVAEEEINELAKDLVIKSTVEDFAVGQIIELKLSNGFEFAKPARGTTESGECYNLTWEDDDVALLEVLADANGNAPDKIEVEAADIEIEAVDAKAGATCVMTVKATNKNALGATLPLAFNARTTVEVMEVVDYTVILSVDEDEDVPVIYSGVDVDNYGITDDSDHWTLEVTAEETFPGAWSFRKGFNLELPEGVYVTDVDITDVDGFLKSAEADGLETVIGTDDMLREFATAYNDGDHVNFEFGKRVFDDVDAELADDEALVSFKLQLVADPGFVGDVTLKLTGELVDEQEVVIANFATPYIVTAEQNDLKIDYRYTEIPTEIVITETEAGLWDADRAEFGFYVEKEDYIVFEDDPTFTVDEESGLELVDAELATLANGVEGIYAMVDKESDEAATVTISDLSLFMQRSIPAGPYDLKGITSMAIRYEAQDLFAPDCDVFGNHTCTDDDNDCEVGDVCDYSDTVKEAFVNVVTAGREQDDASFTTKVVVPVGENYLVAGEVQYDLDVPAYINANGYTMLPVRAVAVALGINNNNVLWDQATKTVTILYGQRIITMQVGASVIYVNGSAIPASSSVEIVDGRTFLGLRDLATALGVTTINWDAATKTASLN